MTAPQPESGWTRALRGAAQGVTFVAAVFCGVVLVLLAVNSAQVRTADAVNDSDLRKLRLEYKQRPEDEALKQRIRALDLRARRVFFASQTFYTTGAILLLFGALALLGALRLSTAIGRKIEVPGMAPPPDRALRSANWSRRFTAAFGVLCLLAALGLMLAPPNAPVPHATPTAPPTPAPAPHAKPGAPPVAARTPGAAAYPSPEESRRQWPAFRGFEGIGIASAANPPVAWDGASGKNIAWKTPLPRHGNSSPIVWSNRVFVTGGDTTNRDVTCLDLATGAVLWRKTVGPFAGSPAEPPKVSDDTGYAAPTPATDGRRVYAIFATGDLAAFHMDGNLAWGRNLGLPDNGYGHSSSLRLYRDLLIVQFDDNASPRVMALKTATGEEVWRTAREHISWASPICVNTGARTEIILACNKSLDSYDPETGARLWTCKCLAGEVAPSPAYADGMVFSVNELEGAQASGTRVPAAGNDVEVQPVWQADKYLPDIASPLASGPYVFFTTSGGTIACRDAQTGALKWEKEFDDGFQASPILAGGNVYALDKNGVTRIFKLADSHAAVGEPKIGEPCSATPAFVGDRILIRGETHLFCIQEKK